MHICIDLRLAMLSILPAYWIYLIKFIHNNNNNNVILLGDLNHDYDSSGHLALNPLYQFETLYSMKQLVEYLVTTRYYIQYRP